ncbi:GlxA family transcriptional regulator [Aestuariivirga sp.]|uniref:GlxA family transcriptional regulator n=1 Tax=Aestuariivirga sp. TaxID=2650926 RepID=UPI003919B79D
MRADSFPPQRDPGTWGDRFISKGSAHYALPAPAVTRDFHFLMLPKMTMLAFSAAVEPLRIANQLTSKCLYRWFLVSEDGGPVRCSNGIPIVADRALREVGLGETIIICSGVDGYLAASEKTLAWLRNQVRHGANVGGVCTGAFTLARAGLLHNRRFTLHWENQAAFRECFPDLTIADQLYCRDGKVMTCGGGNACIDMMVSMIAEHHGEGLATRVLEMCLNSGHRVGSRHQRLSIAAEIGVRHPHLVDVLKEMNSRFDEEIDFEDMAKRYGLSRRQLERLFQTKLGTSPAQKLREIRLARANSLLAETDMSITDIAAACGFSSADSFRKRYRMAFGAAPSSRFKMCGLSPAY